MLQYFVSNTTTRRSGVSNCQTVELSHCITV